MLIDLWTEDRKTALMIMHDDAPFLSDCIVRMTNGPSAEAADLSETGAAAFHRQLVHGNLSSEYANDLRLWLMSLGDVLPNLDV